MVAKKILRSTFSVLSILSFVLVFIGCSISPQGLSKDPDAGSLKPARAKTAKEARPKIPINFEGTFQGEKLANWDTKRCLGSKKYLNDPNHYSFQIVKDKWSDDKFAGRFEVRKTDQIINGGWRAEFKDKYTAMPGDRVWYSLEFLIPEDFVTREKSVVIAQWHDAKEEGIPCQRPQLSVRIVCGVLHVYLWNDMAWDFSCAKGACGEGPGLLLFSGSVDRERWNKIDVETVWSAGDDGLIDIKLNGQVAVNYKGSTSYADDIYGPYFKLGIYTVHPFEDPIVVYYKNFKRSILRLMPQSKNLEPKREKRICLSCYPEAA
jgi:Polysaccharide lyase